MTIGADKIISVEKIKQKVFTNFEKVIKYKQKERRWNYVWKEFEILQIEKQYVDERTCRFSPDFSYGDKPL